MGVFELKSAGSKGPAGVCHQEGLHNDVLRSNAIWFINLRWGVAFVLALIALVDRFAPSLYGGSGVSSSICWACRLSVVLLVSNIYFSFRVKRLNVKSSRRSVYAHLWLQIVVDLIVLTAAVHYVGSIQTFVAFTYLFHVVLACIFFSRWSSLMVTLLASALYVSCVALEASGLWDSVSMTASIFAAPPDDLSVIVIHTASAIAVWLIVWYLVSTLSSTVQAQNADIHSINRQLRRAGEEKNHQMLHITHDLKAPFAGIESNIQMLRLLHWDSLTEEVKGLVERIEIRSKTLRERIKEILLLGDLRGASGERRKVRTEDVDARELFNEVLDEISTKAADREISIQVNVPEISFRSNKKQLVRLFSNLLSNAVLYSPEGESVEILGKDSPDGFIISIIDHGIGISEEALPRIFEEFYSSKEGARFNKQSSGLGLAIVSEIVDLLSLSIRAESRIGEGTRFDVTIPAERTGSASDSTEYESTMARIQIIDDEVDLAQNLKILLEKAGHTAYVYHEPAGAADEIVKNAPDLLILDVMFPGHHAGGFDIAREVRMRDQLKGLPIIMLTSVNQEMPVDFSAKDIDSDWMPVQEFMDKPVDMPVLLQKIQDYLKG